MKRLAIYLFFDSDGIVDDYIPYKLEKLQEFAQDIWFVSNSGLTVESRKKIQHCTTHIMCRENVGFDVWGYKEAIEKIGFDKLAEYDEVILLNYTFFAPIFPFSELFEWSEKQDVDFWGISDHAEIKPNPYTGTGVLPKHIQSHFIAIRKNLLKSFEFQEYWSKMPMIHSYTDSVLLHESRFTNYFFKKGYNYSVYIDSDDFPVDYPTFLSIEETLKHRCPILKRRPFFHDPIYHDKECLFLRRTIEYIEKNTEYNVNYIFSNILRTTKPKDLATNLTLLKVFDSVDLASVRSDIKILVIAHIYYPDMVEEIVTYTENLPCSYDLLITTSNEKSKLEIESNPILKGLNTNNIKVKIVEQNRGRDMSSLFITCKDEVLNSDYDWICRLHSKKSPQNSHNMSQHFKEMMYLNLLRDKNYTSKLIKFLDSNQDIGFAMPSMIHIGHPTLGYAWFTNRELAIEVANKVGIKLPFDNISPFAAYGTMFWFRPKALHKLFEYEWKFEDFNKEPMHCDGSLAHVLERLLAYAANDAGFLAYNIMSSEMAELNYTKLEYKTQRLVSNLSNGDVPHQIRLLESVRLFGAQGNNLISNRFFFINFIRLLKMHVLVNYPRIANLTRNPYRKIRHWYHILKGKFR